MRTILTAIAIFLFVSTAGASSYRFLDAEELKGRITAGDDLAIVDIQVKDEFEQHHISNSVATYAYPVKSDDDRARLAPVVEEEMSTARPVVIVCPRGAGGAKRTYDYLLEQGISAERLWILKKGMAGWKYEDLTATTN